MKKIRLCLALLLSCFKNGFSDTVLVDSSKGEKPPTWIFPENETNESRLTQKLEACDIIRPSSSRATKGFCLKLTECPPLLASLRNHREWPTICYYEGNEPVICCPNVVNGLPKNLPSRNLIVSGCGIRPGAGLDRRRKFREASFLAGGQDAVPFSWPWMVAIFRKIGNTFNYHCGGAFISNQYILSAAHCFAGDGITNNPNDYAIRLRIHERYMGVLHNITSIKLHEDYNDHFNDIAILKLRNVLPSQSKPVPVCLPPSSFNSVPGTQAIVTGWGRPESFGRGSPILQEAELLVFSNSECNSSYSMCSPTGITSNMMCAGQKNGGKGDYKGDPGGPLVYYDGNTWSLIGLVSFGYRCDQAGFPGIYTRVSSYIDWIALNTNYLEINS